MKEKKMLYIGGVPRSGSTWTGKVVGSHSKIRYYHEPFHPRRNHDGNPFFDFFEYVPENSPLSAEKKLATYVKRLKNYDVSKLYDVHDRRNGRKLGILFHPIHKAYSKVKKQIPLIKDPSAIFAAEWLSKNYNMKTLFIIRHPAAFVQSSKKSGWHYGMHRFLEQPQLMDTYLSSFKEELQADLNKGTSEYFLENSVLMWRIAHHVFSEYRKKYSNWYFCRHEDLVEDPHEEFKKVFDFLDLSFDPAVEKYIDISTTATSADESRLKRDAKKLRFKWKEKLTSGEVERIKILAEKEWNEFYTEDEW